MSVIAKLMERIVCNRLRHHLENRNLIPYTQSGFRRGRSTADPLLRLVNDMHEAFQNKEVGIAVAVDLSRAFDKVRYQKLLLVFNRLGIPSCYAKWFLGFLSDRRYRVRYGDVKSRLVRFATGVPQGSVSGPLLFIIYMITLEERLSRLGNKGLEYHLFADDSTIWKIQNDLSSCAEVIQSGLDVISTWSNEYNMPISVGKNEAIIFCNSSSVIKKAILPRIVLGEDVVRYKDEIRLLGVMFDCTLSFKAQVRKIRQF